MTGNHALTKVGNRHYVHTCLTTSRKVEIIKSIIDKLEIAANVVIE